MIRSLFRAAVSFLLAAREERLALAELHRAQALRASAPEVVRATADGASDLAKALQSLKTEDEDAPEFFACSYRAAHAFFLGTQNAETVPCPFHEDLAKGEACPGEPEDELRTFSEEPLPPLVLEPLKPVITQPAQAQF